MLERAGQIKTDKGKVVSITALPVAESLEGDITGYIQTNLMSITDGHVFFDIERFKSGARPAVNHALSVSRVGNQTRQLLEKELAQKVREDLSRYEKDKEIARFGVDLPEATRAEIDLGEKIELVLNQDTETLVPAALSLGLLGLLLGGFWKEKKAEQVKVDLIKLTQKYQSGSLKDLEEKLAKVAKIDDLILLMKSYSEKVEASLHE